MRLMIDHDSLTGVLSLNGFRKRAEELLKLHPDIPYVISYSNIKNFKYINDSFGMEAGNELLRFWAESTQTVISGLDVFARLEADHFAMLRHITGEGQMNTDTKLVFEPLRDFFVRRNKKIRVQICTGVYSLSPIDYQDINIDRIVFCSLYSVKNTSFTSARLSSRNCLMTKSSGILSRAMSTAVSIPLPFFLF